MVIERDAGTLMALRMSFWLPVAFATIFLLFDIYHVYTQTVWTGMEVKDITSLYGLALLKGVNSYFPSTLLPFAVFAVLQQSIYHVFSGLVLWKLDGLLFWTFGYSALYIVYIAQGGEDLLLTVVLAVFTAVFGFGIWLSLDERVRKAQRTWRTTMGAG